MPGLDLSVDRRQWSHGRRRGSPKWHLTTGLSPQGEEARVGWAWKVLQCPVGLHDFSSFYLHYQGPSSHHLHSNKAVRVILLEHMRSCLSLAQNPLTVPSSLREKAKVLRGPQGPHFLRPLSLSPTGRLLILIRHQRVYTGCSFRLKCCSLSYRVARLLRSMSPPPWSNSDHPV